MSDNRTQKVAWSAPDFTLPTANWNLGLTVISLLAAVCATYYFHTPRIYAVVFVLSVSWYAMASLQLGRQGKPTPESEVIAEQIVVFGIASLIVHVVMASYAFFDGWSSIGTGGAINLEAVRDAAESFLAGMLCAAVAPVVAVLYRSVRNSASYSLEREGYTGGGASAITSLVTPLSMGDAPPGVSEAHRLSAVVREAAEEFEKAAARLIGAVGSTEAGLTKAAGGTELAFGSLTTVLEQKSAETGAALDGLSTSFTAQTSKIAAATEIVAASLIRNQDTLTTAIETAAGAIATSASPLRDSIQTVATAITLSGEPLKAAVEQLGKELQASSEAVSERETAQRETFRRGLADFDAAIRRGNETISQALQHTSKALTAAGDPVRASLQTLADSIEQSAAPFSSNIIRLGRDLQESTDVLRRGTAAMESQLKTLQDGLTGIVADLNSTSKALATSLDAASTGTQGFQRDIDSLSVRLRETGELLQNLEALILSVRRFISTDGTTSSRTAREQ